MTVWCSSTWLSTEPSAYLVSGSPRGDLDGLGDGDAQRAGVVGGERPAGGRQLRRRAVHRAAEGLDQRAPVRLRVVGRADLPDLALHVEQRAGEGQRRAPLAGAGLGGQLPDAGLGVVVHLRHSGVRLVRAGRRDALVLVVDPRRRAERLLEPVRPVQRRRPPQPVDVLHLVRDVDVATRSRPPAGSAPSGTAARDRPARPAAWVPGCSGGGGGAGRSGMMLYQRVGISRLVEQVLVLPDRHAPPRGSRMDLESRTP